MSNNRQGFTLVEVSVASFVIIIIGIGLLGIRQIIVQSQFQTVNNFLKVEDANYIVSTLTRELRTARPGDNGAYPFELCANQELTFYTNADSDQETEKVSYFLDGTNLVKSIINPTSTSPITYPQEQVITKIISTNVQNNTSPLFFYYNQDWPQDTTNNPLTTPATLLDVAIIKIYLRLNTIDAETDYVLESFSHVRTLKNNL